MLLPCLVSIVELFIYVLHHHPLCILFHFWPYCPFQAYEIFIAKCSERTSMMEVPRQFCIWYILVDTVLNITSAVNKNDTESYIREVKLKFHAGEIRNLEKRYQELHRITEEISSVSVIQFEHHKLDCKWFKFILSSVSEFILQSNICIIHTCLNLSWTYWL